MEVFGWSGLLDTGVRYQPFPFLDRQVSQDAGNSIS